MQTPHLCKSQQHVKCMRIFKERKLCPCTIDTTAVPWAQWSTRTFSIQCPISGCCFKSYKKQGWLRRHILECHPSVRAFSKVQDVFRAEKRSIYPDYDRTSSLPSPQRISFQLYLCILLLKQTNIHRMYL